MRALGQRGGSLVEFAIVTPVLVSLIMFATYFADAWDFKLKNQEAARFAAWEFTAFPLSDYVNADNRSSGALFTRASGKIKTDLNTIYNDFDSSQNSAPTTSLVGTHQLELGKLDIQNLQTPMDDGKALSSIPGIGGLATSLFSFANKGLDFVGPEAFKFNQNGLIQVTVTSKFTNTLLPSNFLGQFRYGQINAWETSDTVALVADAWTLDDGRDVLPADNGGPSTIEGNGTMQHPMATEVNRMAFLGLGNLIPTAVADAISTIDGILGDVIPDPLFLFAAKGQMRGAPVVSLNYRRAQGSDSYTYTGAVASDPARHGELDFKKVGRPPDSGQAGFETMPFRVTNAYSNSPLVQIFQDSNKYYMGCVNPETADTASSNCHP